LRAIGHEAAGAPFPSTAMPEVRTVQSVMPDSLPWPPQRTRLYDARWRAALHVCGADARKWLNGMVSANVRDLAPGRVAPSFQLDPKGHVLAMFEVLCTASDCFWLLSDRGQLPGLMERLRKFVFISKLQLEALTPEWGALWLRGSAWRGAWEAAGLGSLGTLTEGEATEAEVEGGRVRVVAFNPGGVAKAEIWCPAALAERLRLKLAAHADAASEEQAERDRILGGEPRYGVDVTAAELAQETGQLDRLSFTKGCYVGQEIVERVRARGAVHRQFATFDFDAAVEPGLAIERQRAPVGRITSATPAGAHWRALGYIRAPDQAAGTEVAAAGACGRVV